LTNEVRPSPIFLQRVPHEIARRHLIFGAAERSGTIIIEHGAPLAVGVVNNLAKWLGAKIELQSVDSEQVARSIDAAYTKFIAETSADSAHEARDGTPLITIDPAASSGADSETEGDQLAALADADLLNIDHKGPVVRLVDTLLFEAIGQGASDIHIQPLTDETLIRYRVDGVLATARSVAVRLAPALVTRIKVMARMDVAERRAPQDGRATVLIGRGGNRRSIDLRISTLPTAFGERVVMRLLYNDQSVNRANIDSLQMPQRLRDTYLDRAGRSSGILLVTGPTGSGKTTTLYATLRWIIGRSSTGQAGGRTMRTADMNVMTIEDPIEYDLTAGDQARSPSGSDAPRRRSLPISQTQVDPRKGLTFASGLRHILRQDPDVIMVGEIRDAETARIAIQASLTGHLVFSTLHTNDAPSAVSRLIDLEVEPFLICSTLSAVLAQRLVRLLHQDCQGAGCAGCLGTGFRGRRALFELMPLDDPLRELIGRRASSSELRALALTHGLRSLTEEGQDLIDQGLTTTAEVQRVTSGVD
jgi:general secretion pathway protein E